VVVNGLASLADSGETPVLFQLESARASDGLSYVSFPPGSFNVQADSVEVQNSNHDLILGAPVIDGGVDPFPIPALVGDSLHITVLALGGTFVLSRVSKVVPEKEPPVVVRTRPRRGQTKVPINRSIAIVLSEPMDGATIDSSTVRLLEGDQTVPSEVILSEDGLFVELITDQPLRLATTYTISVTAQLRDLSGSTLQEVYTSDFTTVEAVGSIRVVTDTNLRGGTLETNGYVVMLDGVPGPRIGVRSSLTLTDVGVGDHLVGIDDLYPYCGKAQSMTVTVRPNNTAYAHFSVNCWPAIVNITTYTSGKPSPFQGFLLTIDDTLSFRIGQTDGTGKLYGLEVGERHFEIAPGPPGCTIFGENPRTVTILEGIEADVLYFGGCV